MYWYEGFMWCAVLCCAALCVCECVCQSYCYGRLHSTQTNGTIMGFPGATATDENLLTAECDILVPAAGERQITADIARNMKAKVRNEG